MPWILKVLSFLSIFYRSNPIESSSSIIFSPSIFNILVSSGTELFKSAWQAASQSGTFLLVIEKGSELSKKLKSQRKLALLIILFMQIQAQKEQELIDPFDIIHNARSSRASRSRKSSISVMDKDKPRTKTKKLRKMTLNPQSIKYEEIKQIEELHQQKTAAHSEKGDMKEQSQINIDDFLDLGWPKKMQSEKEIQLQSGIYVGIGNQRELDSDFNWGQSSQKMDQEF